MNAALHPVRPDPVATRMLLGELEQLRAAQTRAGNRDAAFLTGEAIRTIHAQDELLDVQGALIDELAARPVPHWIGVIGRLVSRVRRG